MTDSVVPPGSANWSEKDKRRYNEYMEYVEVDLENQIKALRRRQANYTRDALAIVQKYKYPKKD